jgi:hypothetical protein
LDPQHRILVGWREQIAEVPCVDGSLLARVFFTVQLVGCGHVFGLLRGSHDRWP